MGQKIHTDNIELKFLHSKDQWVICSQSRIIISVKFKYYFAEVR